MKNSALIIFLIAFSTYKVTGQKVEVIKFPELQQIINEDNADLKVINFWATWCKPCIEELPYFEEINRNYKKNDLEVILVSLDFVEQVDTKVKDFVEKEALASKLYLLDETDYNKIIDSIHTSWSGAIPATLIVDNRKNKKDLYERQFKEGELSQLIKTLIN
ncbi:TlpA disulfide reductase family protein [Fulvivirgaceae bacterium BMA12]|uniref:TlpA disulfide reductase family protein n=1 Tax=Agaribacillus aureus TaxID=3051825 RepID=A0ABT8LHJ0_9BACT|nr:TlpA disulfide reductase family protein [Fulvivirgaceae bacterium BMA12]